MPFGTEISGGGTSFRLWAPSVKRVELLWSTDPEQPERSARMHRTDDGWHSLELAEARTGDRYRYRIDNGLAVPDPASRFQPDDVHGPSEIIDACARSIGVPAESAWQGRPWHQSGHLRATCRQLFSSDGELSPASSRRLDHLAELGVTAIELMPLADFPGQRNWGYDGALLYTPDASYGHPNDLKRLIRAAHQRGLMVLLDVVYNHFGP
jgi:maltooligosyltrehalose trehalohydrolase